MDTYMNNMEKRGPLKKLSYQVGACNDHSTNGRSSTWGVKGNSMIIQISGVVCAHFIWLQGDAVVQRKRNAKRMVVFLVSAGSPARFWMASSEEKNSLDCGAIQYVWRREVGRRR
jgi:hypothetical protein